MWYKSREFYNVKELLGHTSVEGVRGPGIHRMTDEEYRAMPGLNWSTIKNTLVSPEYAKHKEKFPIKATSSMEMGSMIHASVLLPSTFNDTYFVAPEIEKANVEFVKGGNGWHVTVDGSTIDMAYKTKKEAQENFPAYTVGGDYACGFSKLGDAKEYVGNLGGDKKVISPDDFNLANDVCKHLHVKDPVAASWLVDILAEVVLIWDETVMLPNGDTTDVRCKAKLDAWDRQRGMVWDLKTTRDSDPDRFVRTIMKYHYHGQLAWYANAVKRVLEGVAPDCFDMQPLTAGIMAVELAPPFQTSCLVLSDEFIEQGEKCFRKALQLWVEGEWSGKWPRRCSGETVVALPAWFKEEEYEF